MTARAAYDRELGRRIAHARTNAGLTQTQLAGLLDRERSSVANMEAGRQRCFAVTVVTLAGLLRADPLWLLLGDSAGAPPSAITPKAVLMQAEELTRIATQLRQLAHSEMADDVRIDMEAT